MLSLAKIQKRHDGCLLILRWVLLYDFFNALLILRIEFEWNASIVIGCITMLYNVVQLFHFLDFIFL